MKYAAGCLLIVLLGMFMGCQGPNLAQRMEADRAAYASWPAAVQAAVAEGRIEVGFTPAQVRMAWGEPSDVATEISAEGEIDRWYYERRGPRFSLGFGVGSYGRSGGVSGGVGTTIGGRSNVIAMARFENGVVVSFERAGTS